MLKLVIGNKNLSSWSLRPWLVFKIAGIPFQEIKISLDQPDTHTNILRHSPSGRVPALIDEQGVICESLAICEFVADRFPEKNLWPKDSWARALARSISSEMHAGFSELRKQMPMHCAESLPVRMISDEVQKDIARICEIWTECRKNYGAHGKFLFGEFCIADAMFAPVVTRFKTYSVPISARPISDYMDFIWNLPAMQEWLVGAREELRTL